jgi:hypothetical protein
LGHSLLARPLLAYLPAIRVTLFLPVVVVVVVVVVVMVAIARADGYSDGIQERLAPDT